ncbi:MAG: DUF1292 domain-containing protein [Clostridia bacterium]|nr:DUF1292 domain-containing protein [Clostridia bacterium]MBR5767915.1 DUF1292 domain-containing protein [Clostridia bacterium]
MADEIFDEEIFTLTDEDGVEKQFELIGSTELNGETYLALVPLEDNENNEYVILKSDVDEDGDDILVTIDDDDEFNKVAEIFDEELFEEIDYDA